MGGKGLLMMSISDRWIKYVNGFEVSLFRPECSKGTPSEEKLLNLISITWYKDLSPESSGLRYSRDDDHSVGTCQWQPVEGHV